MAPKKKTPGTYNYIAGLDVGNGYTKGLIEHKDRKDLPADVIDMPSSSTVMLSANAVPVADKDAKNITHDTRDDFFNNLDVSFATPLVADSNRRLLGRHGLDVAGSMHEQFQLSTGQTKAKQELSKIIVLGVLAGKAVKDYVEETGGLPSAARDGDPAALRVSVVAALALPISEYMSHRDSYVASFVGANPEQPTVHTVTVGNFETRVTVQVVFRKVYVIAEGASAQFAITQYGKPLAAELLSDARAMGMELTDIEPEDVVGVRSTIGIDIGEGTVNFPVFTEGKFNRDASSSMNRGYGTVLENTIDKLNADNFSHSFDSRKKLADFLQRGPSKFQRGDYDKIKMEVEKSAELFAGEIVMHFEKVFRQARLTEAIYVYGGGAMSMRDVLYPRLVAKMQELVSAGERPVFYLGQEYSRNLNREGLVIAARGAARSS
jgi:plasmid segregation protein ParM